MYTKLKDVMRSKGYEVSEGGDWAASDTPQFTAFAKFVLGAQHVSPNQVMAYPQAFPVLVEAMNAMAGESAPIDPPAPAAAPIDPPAPEAAPAPAEAAPIDPPADTTSETVQAPEGTSEGVLTPEDAPDAPAEDSTGAGEGDEHTEDAPQE